MIAYQLSGNGRQCKQNIMRKTNIFNHVSVSKTTVARRQSYNLTVNIHNTVEPVTTLEPTCL